MIPKLAVYGGLAAAIFLAAVLLWPVVPLFLYWVSRIWLIAQRGNMNEDPVAWAVGDRVSWLMVLSVMLLAMLAAA